MKVFVPALALLGLLGFGQQAKAQSTVSAEYKFDVSRADNYRTSIGSTYRLNPLYVSSFLGFNISSIANTSNWGIGNDSGGNNGAAMLLGGIAGDLQFVTFPTLNPSQPRTISDNDIRSNIRMILSRDGRLQLGTTLPNQTVHGDYKLAVAGKIVGQSLFITNPSTWADFVFAPTYQLMSLPKLEAYLHQNKHLPAIPSASEVEEKGYSVTDMDAKLLQTVEELTLHLIALNKQVQDLQAALNSKTTK